MFRQDVLINTRLYALTVKAKSDGTSMNKTFYNLLAQALQVASQGEQERRKDFLELFGVWSENDESEFRLRTRELDKVHQEDWQ